MAHVNGWQMCHPVTPAGRGDVGEMILWVRQRTDDQQVSEWSISHYMDSLLPLLRKEGKSSTGWPSGISPWNSAHFVTTCSNLLRFWVKICWFTLLCAPRIISPKDLCSKARREGGRLQIWEQLSDWREREQSVYAVNGAIVVASSTRAQIRVNLSFTPHTSFSVVKQFLCRHLNYLFIPVESTYLHDLTLDVQ